MNLESLPYDKVFEICESLDLKDLNRLVRTSKTIEDICGRILTKKKNELIDEHYERVIDVDRTHMHKALKEGFSQIRLSPGFIEQTVDVNHSEIPWPLPKYESKVFEVEDFPFFGSHETVLIRQVNFEPHLDELEIGEIIEDLVNQGYF